MLPEKFPNRSVPLKNCNDVGSFYIFLYLWLTDGVGSCLLTHKYDHFLKSDMLSMAIEEKKL